MSLGLQGQHWVGITGEGRDCGVLLGLRGGGTQGDLTGVRV